MIATIAKAIISIAQFVPFAKDLIEQVSGLYIQSKIDAITASNVSRSEQKIVISKKILETTNVNEKAALVTTFNNI